MVTSETKGTKMQTPLEQALEIDTKLDRDLFAFLSQLNYRDAIELRRLFTNYPAPVVAFRLMLLGKDRIQVHDRPKCTVCP